MGFISYDERVTKKHVFIALAVLIPLILIFAAILFLRQVQLGIVSLPLPFPSPRPSGTPARQFQQLETNAQEQSQAFYFQGHFKDKLFILNGVIMGDFILKDDPNQVPIRTIFTAETGNFTVGQTVGETTSYDLMSGQSLIASIEPNRPYELRVFVDEPLDEAKQHTLDMLNELKADKNVQANKYTLVPSMIRNLE